MGRVLTLLMLGLIIGVLALSGCAGKPLNVDYSYKGKVLALSKGSPVLIRCEVTGLEGMDADSAYFYVEYKQADLCIGCPENGKILESDSNFRHAWGTQFRNQLIDSVGKNGFKPLGAQLSITQEGSTKPLLVEGKKQGAKYILYAQTNIHRQAITEDPLNFLRAFILSEKWYFTMKVRNSYSLINPKTGGIIFQRYYDETVVRTLDYINHGDIEYWREYIRLRNDCFTELQNKLIEKFWFDIQAAKLMS